MLFEGQFETDIDLILHENIREFTGIDNLLDPITMEIHLLDTKIN